MKLGSGTRLKGINSLHVSVLAKFCFALHKNILIFEVTVIIVFCPIPAIPQTTLLAIEIAAPVGGLLLAIICIMCCVIIGLCVRQSRLKHTRDNYNFQRLSIAAQDYDDEAEDEEDDDERDK